jgi:ornithine carbamoyltransferase
VKELDVTAAELRYLIALAAELKAAAREGSEERQLTGRRLALIYGKGSARSRGAMEIAAHDQGARASYLVPHRLQFGHHRPVKATALVLGRRYDAIGCRGASQDVAEELAAHAGVPVYNERSDRLQPPQALADMLTMQEHSRKHVRHIAYCFVGGRQGDMGNSLMMLARSRSTEQRTASTRSRRFSSPRSGSERAGGSTCGGAREVR